MKSEVFGKDIKKEGVTALVPFVIILLVCVFLFALDKVGVGGNEKGFYDDVLTIQEVGDSSNSFYTGLNERNINENMESELDIFRYLLRYSTLEHDTAFEVANAIIDSCEKYRIDPYLVLAIIKVESDFNPKAVSPRGAIGLMQLMPSTARYVAKKLGINYTGRKSIFDPTLNVELGVAYISLLKQRYGDIEHALGAYNYGPNSYSRIRGEIKDFRPSYVRRVIGFKTFLESKKDVITSES